MEQGPLAVVRAYDALNPDIPDGPLERLWMRDLETAWQNTFARLQASATRPPAQVRSASPSAVGMRRRESRMTPQWTQRNVVQQLTIVFAITAAALAVAALALLLARM